MECVPLDANKKADKKKTKILKFILFCTVVFNSISDIDPGIADNKYSSNASTGIENLDVIAPIKAIKGISDNTKKKASCPGSTRISGRATIEITFLINPVTRSIYLHPFFTSFLLLL